MALFEGALVSPYIGPPYSNFSSIFSEIFPLNLCDPDPPTLYRQTDRQTDRRRHAISIPRFAVCTIVHRAVIK